MPSPWVSSSWSHARSRARARRFGRRESLCIRCAWRFGSNLGSSGRGCFISFLIQELPNRLNRVSRHSCETASAVPIERQLLHQPHSRLHADGAYTEVSVEPMRQRHREGVPQRFVVGTQDAGKRDVVRGVSRVPGSRCWGHHECCGSTDCERGLTRGGSVGIPQRGWWYAHQSAAWLQLPQPNQSDSAGVLLGT